MCLFLGIVVRPQPMAAEPTLDGVLKHAAAYLANFHQQLSDIVAEETYDQRVFRNDINSRAPAARRLKSDLLLVQPHGSGRYVEFRDVFEVDGHPVRDRHERLTRLFNDPSAAGSDQMASIINESARYNIGDLVRTVNTPLMPLLFLDPEYQPRFKFKRAKTTAMAPGTGRSTPKEEASPVFRVSTEMWTIEYEERGPHTVIKTPQGRDLPARGRYWINPDTGAVLMTELLIGGDEVKVNVTVSYQSEPLMGFLVPVEMRESYAGVRDRIEGTAVYGRFRVIK